MSRVHLRHLQGYLIYIKGLIINISGFAGHTISVATAQLCESSHRNMCVSGCGWVPVKLYLQDR